MRSSARLVAARADRRQQVLHARARGDRGRLDDLGDPRRTCAARRAPPPSRPCCAPASRGRARGPARAPRRRRAAARRSAPTARRRPRARSRPAAPRPARGWTAAAARSRAAPSPGPGTGGARRGPAPSIVSTLRRPVISTAPRSVPMPGPNRSSRRSTTVHASWPVTSQRAQSLVPGDGPGRAEPGVAGRRGPDRACASRLAAPSSCAVESIPRSLRPRLGPAGRHVRRQAR